MKGKLSTIILGALLIVAVYFAFIKGGNGDNEGKTKDVKKSLKRNDLNSQDPNTEQVPIIQPPVQNITTPANGEPDAYGRLPGDAHYGHDHAVETQQPNIQQNTQQTGPDKFGRQPGDAHYGHDHE